MQNLNLDEANERTREELAKVSKELGHPWEICDYSGFELTPQKGYTARAGSHLYFHKTLAGGEGNLVAVLFQPGDNTGNQKWVPRKKEGEAELFLSLGSSVDGEWFPGLTHLISLDKPYNPKEPLSEGASSYKNLTSSQQDYIGRLAWFEEVPPRRFDFTFERDREKVQGYGNPHVIGFPNSLVISASPFEINYQIGAFVSFPRECTELGVLREIVRDSFLGEAIDKGKIKL